MLDRHRSQYLLKWEEAVNEVTQSKEERERGNNTGVVP
jgi:hypothetical protein